MQVELVNYWGSDLTVVNSARVSLGKHKDTVDKSDIKLIKYLVDHNHVSTLEHCGFTFRVKCPIFVARQIFRHCSWKFNEQSLRYIEAEPSFFQPEQFRQQDASIKQGSKSLEDSKLNNKLASLIYNAAIKISYWSYKLLLKIGVCKEQARALLPLAVYTEFYATCNLRSLYHFLLLRLDKHTQVETREVAQQMLDLVKNIEDNPFQYSLEAFKL